MYDLGSEKRLYSIFALWLMLTIDTRFRDYDLLACQLENMAKVTSMNNGNLLN